jgi:uncharacterized membrane protein
LQILKKHIRKYLLTGILALIPVFLTVWAFLVMVKWTDRILGLIPRAYRPEALFGFPIPGLGLILSLLAIYVIGAFVANVMGRSLLNLGERILEKIPLLRWFYFSSKQLLEAIFVQGQDSFRRAILVEYPRKGIYSIGFVTGEARSELDRHVPGRAYTVFVPTTPNPTSGYLIIVPEAEAIPLGWSVDDAFRIIISAGVLMPGEKNFFNSRDKGLAMQEDQTTEDLAREEGG